MSEDRLIGDALHDAVAQRLSAGGHIYTSGRRSLVEALAGIERPLTIPELVQQRPALRQSSAYRNVGVLEELGVVVRILSGAEHARFELSDDLLGHHHHVICTACGRVEDFTVPARVERTIHDALQQAVDATGYEPEGHRFDVLGVCPACLVA